MIPSVIDRIYQVFECKFLLSEQSDESELAKRVTVRKKRFYVIKKKFKIQILIIYRSDQKRVELLILTNQTNYFMK